MNVKTHRKTNQRNTPKNYIVLGKTSRMAILGKAQGIWKNRKPDPIAELRKMRREWDRKLP